MATSILPANSETQVIQNSSGGKRLVKSKSGLKIVCQHDRESAPWDMAEPQWTPDKEVTTCLGCQAKFDFIKRKHHCRRCGHIFCNKCCSSKVQFHRMGFVDPVRLCTPCSTVTKQEEEFFNAHLKLLFSGATFNVSTSVREIESPLSDEISSDLQETKEDRKSPAFSTLSTDTEKLSLGREILYNCKLSSDQRFLILDCHESVTSSPAITPTYDGDKSTSVCDQNGSEQHKKQLGINVIRPIDLSKITDAETHNAEKQGAEAVTLQLKVSPTEEMILKLTSPPEPSRKPSVLFIGALIKGLRMVFESRRQFEAEEELE